MRIAPKADKPAARLSRNARPGLSRSAALGRQQLGPILGHQFFGTPSACFPLFVTELGRRHGAAGHRITDCHKELFLRPAGVHMHSIRATPPDLFRKECGALAGMLIVDPARIVDVSPRNVNSNDLLGTGDMAIRTFVQRFHLGSWCFRLMVNVSTRVRHGSRRRTRRRCALQVRTAMPGSERERPLQRHLNGNEREFEDFLILQVGVGSAVSASLARQIKNAVDCPDRVEGAGVAALECHFARPVVVDPVLIA
jgi:hypothetical protein